MVVDKPAGLVVHASAKFYFNTLARLVDERFPGERWQVPPPRPRTSGVLVMAQGREAAARVKGAFFRKQTRTYLAIVRGHPTWPGEHLIDLPLGLPGRAGPLADVRMVVRPTASPRAPGSASWPATATSPSSAAVPSPDASTNPRPPRGRRLPDRRR